MRIRENKIQKQRYIAVFIIVVVLLIDQISKLWIKLNMQLGDEVYIFDWFRIYFLENDGMAFGFSFGGEWGKLVLSLLRIIIISFGIWYLFKSIKENKRNSFVISLSMILAGAIGNMIDSAFYGLIFSESYMQIATLFPEGGGYASFLYGRVVDMLYFPLISGYYPSWFPIIGGDNFLFFSPVFNIADSSVCVGFALFFITQKEFWQSDDAKGEKAIKDDECTPSESNKDNIPKDSNSISNKNDVVEAKGENI